MFVKPKRWYFNYFVCGQIPEEAPKKWRSRINGTRSQRPISNDEAKAQMGELLAAEDSGLECGTSKGDWRKAQHTDRLGTNRCTISLACIITGR